MFWRNIFLHFKFCYLHEYSFVPSSGSSVEQPSGTPAAACGSGLRLTVLPTLQIFSENGRFSTLVAYEIFTKICKDFWPENHNYGRFLPFKKKLQKMTDFYTNCASFGRFCIIICKNPKFFSKTVLKIKNDLDFEKNCHIKMQ